MTIPRHVNGDLDIPTFERHILFLANKGINGFALNGATGEYCLTSEADLTRVLRNARKALGPRVTVLAGIGGASDLHSLRLLSISQNERADGVLLPMPHYFPYSQEDLSCFVKNIVAEASIPVLLYNLPSFTSPLEPATSAKLISELDQVIGIKDSSGELDTVRLLTTEVPNANRVIGNDEALYEALKQQLCDGVVSGVACVLPELMLAFYQAIKADAAGVEAARLRSLVDEFISWLTRFPVPWGLKMIAQERGFGRAIFPMPLSEQRAKDYHAFTEWFAQNRCSLLASDSLDPSAH